ncbi:hypothetical protein Hanom_Chr07g00656761 [Helianthus anomalus]
MNTYVYPSTLFWPKSLLVSTNINVKSSFGTLDLLTNNLPCKTTNRIITQDL